MDALRYVYGSAVPREAVGDHNPETNLYDIDAKYGDVVSHEEVMRYLEEVDFAPVDADTLSESKRHEPGSPIHNVPMSPQEAREALAGID